MNPLLACVGRAVVRGLGELAWRTAWVTVGVLAGMALAYAGIWTGVL